jgi:hypothetical protein
MARHQGFFFQTGYKTTTNYQHSPGPGLSDRNKTVFTQDAEDRETVTSRALLPKFVLNA